MSDDANDVSAYMPIWIGDYLRDTLDFTTVEHGAYMLLLMHQWQHGSIPRDHKNLCQITRLHGRGAKKVLEKCLSKYSVGISNCVNERARKEKARAIERKAKSLEKAKKAANARWAKRQIDDACSISEAMHKQCPPTPTSTTTKVLASTRRKEELKAQVREIKQRE